MKKFLGYINDKEYHDKTEFWKAVDALESGVVSTIQFSEIETPDPDEQNENPIETKSDQTEKKPDHIEETPEIEYKPVKNDLNIKNIEEDFLFVKNFIVAETLKNLQRIVFFDDLNLKKEKLEDRIDKCDEVLRPLLDTIIAEYVAVVNESLSHQETKEYAINVRAKEMLKTIIEKLLVSVEQRNADINWMISAIDDEFLKRSRNNELQAQDYAAKRAVVPDNPELKTAATNYYKRDKIIDNKIEQKLEWEEMSRNRNAFVFIHKYYNLVINKLNQFLTNYF